MSITGIDEFKAQAKEVKRKKYKIEAITLRDYLKEDFGEIKVFVGKENDALIVPGEGSFMPGQGNVGKTPLIADFAFKMVCGFDILRWRVPEPLKVLILQAELPDRSASYTDLGKCSTNG